MGRFGASIVLAAFVLLSVSSAQAERSVHDSRVRLLVHGKHVFPDYQNVKAVKARFVPSGNLIGTVAPVAFLGPVLRVVDGFYLEPYVGWAFGPDRPVFSLTTNLSYGPFWAWTATDYVHGVKGGYWFAQVEYVIVPWLHFGVEGEGFGTWGDAESWSHGVGPNILLRFDGFGFDFSVHDRTIPELGRKPEFFLRAHIFAF